VTPEEIAEIDRRQVELIVAELARLKRADAAARVLAA